jgi:intracellular multiplication protein IcmT
MSKEIADIKEQLNWHWRNTMRPVRFLAFDVKAIIPFCVLLFYARLSSLIFAILVTVFFHILEKKGLTFEAALRTTRIFMFGQKRYGLPKVFYRRLKDFGR